MRRGIATPISLKSVIASAKQQLSIDNTNEHDLFLYRLADEAIGQVGSLDTFVKQTECFEIDNYRFELPNGFVRPIAMRLEGTSTDRINSNVVYFDKDFLRECQCEIPDNDNYPNLRSTGQIVDGYWVFNTDTTATHAVMTYLGRNLDEDCIMVMYENQERAVRSYLCWNFTRRFFKMFPPNISESYRQEWMAQRRYLIGENVARDFRNKRQQIGSIASALIINQNFSI